MVYKLSSDEEQVVDRKVKLSDQSGEDDVIHENLVCRQFFQTIKNIGNNISLGAQEKLNEFKKEWSGFFSDELVI